MSRKYKVEMTLDEINLVLGLLNRVPTSGRESMESMIELIKKFEEVLKNEK